MMAIMIFFIKFTLWPIYDKLVVIRSAFADNLVPLDSTQEPKKSDYRYFHILHIEDILTLCSLDTVLNVNALFIKCKWPNFVGVGLAIYECSPISVMKQL